MINRYRRRTISVSLPLPLIDQLDRLVDQERESQEEDQKPATRSALIELYITHMIAQDKGEKGE